MHQVSGGTALLLALALIVLTILWQKYEQKHRCVYCGEYRGHTAHCPYERLENH